MTNSCLFVTISYLGPRVGVCVCVCVESGTFRDRCFRALHFGYLLTGARTIRPCIACLSGPSGVGCFVDMCGHLLGPAYWRDYDLLI